MELRRRTAIVALALGIALAGCASPAARPTPAPSFFADADAAYAAAEATYRAYVDALNARRGNADSEPEPNAFLTGQALENEVEAQAQLSDLSLRVIGQSIVVSFVPVTTADASTEVVAEVCLDSTATRVMDSTGSDVTPDDRENLTSLSVTLQRLGEDWVITRSTVGEHEC